MDYQQMRTKADRILDKLPSDDGVDQESLVRMVSEHFETFSELVDAVREVHYKKTESDHTPRAFGYRRVSTEDQARDGFSLESQKKTVEKYFVLLKDRVVIPNGELQWGGFFVDAGESAYKKELRMRERGSAMCHTLREGDHIIFCRLDRAFRNIKDFIFMTDLWNRVGITCHFIDHMIDMSTATGNLFARLAAAMAQWESEVKGERIREALKARNQKLTKSKNGKLIGMPEGTRYVQDRKWTARILINDPEARKMARLVQRLREQEGMTWKQIGDAVEKILCEREGRTFIRYPSHRGEVRQWTKEKLITVYKFREELFKRDMDDEKQP